MNPLDSMAQTLRDYGWKRLQSGDTDTGFCLLGAWKHAYQHGRYTGDECFNALATLRDTLEDLYGSALVVEVNDRLLADADEAIAVCEKASARYAEVYG